MSILIKNGLIVPQTGKKPFFTGDIFIDDFIISEISTSSLSLEADVVIDASDMIVLPGLINTHTHVPMTLLRGYGDDMLLQEWLSDRIWPVEARLNKEYVEIASKLAFLEMIASGTTMFSDMYFFEDTIAKVALDAGLRAALGFALIDAGTPEYSSDQLFQKLEQFIRTWKNHDHIYPVIAPHGTYTCGVETLEKVSNLSDRYDVLVHTHCSETRDEVYDVQRRFGVRPVEQLKKYGLLHDHMILAHCGWITKNEVTDMGKAGAKVSHCPVSNMKIATGGYAPIPELLKAGVPVSLGTDGAASNNSLDMFDTMKMTALVHKQHRWDPQVMPAGTVLDCATIGGAVTLGLKDRIGSLEEGKLADIICIDAHSPHLTPCHDPISNLVYTARGSDVCTTIVNGTLLYHDRQFLTLSDDEILQKAQVIAKDLTSGLQSS
jgi:5-methylthioadenosine/S-adenosylhomocysteine deaminase